MVSKTLKKLTRHPRQLTHDTVVVSTKTLNSAFNGVFKALKTITKGTRKVSETALMVGKKRKTNKRKTNKKRRKH